MMKNLHKDPTNKTRSENNQLITRCLNSNYIVKKVKNK